MAIIDHMPNQDVIDLFAGKVDFYLWRGIPCARKWPRYTKREPTPEEAFNQADFAYINTRAGDLNSIQRASVKQYAKNTDWTWRDMLVKAYMSGIFE